MNQTPMVLRHRINCKNYLDHHSQERDKKDQEHHKINIDQMSHNQIVGLFRSNKEGRLH